MTSNLFEEIKRQVNLESYMVQTSGGKVSNAGSFRRINPCPHCSHKDCCTLYDDGTYACFSCGHGGDVINYERQLHNHSNNKEAAEALAKKFNIHIDNTGQHKSGNKPPAEPAPDKTPTDNIPIISRDKAFQLRARAADLFHQALMNNPDALKYQIETRKHDLETIKKFKIGLGVGKVFDQLKGEGWTVDDLCAIALLRKKAKGFRQAIQRGMFVYPHFVDGKVAHFTIKDPLKNFKWQLKRYGSDADWLFYGQDAVKADTIWMVEGEDDRITLITKGKVEHVVATIGNSNTPNILAWLASNAEGKTFYLCYDPDDAGKRYTEKFGTAIVNGGGQAMAIDVSGYHGDIDKILRDAERPRQIVSDLIKKHATAVVIPTTEQEANKARGYKFSSFDVLGELADGRIAFWSNVYRRMNYASLKDLTLDFLCRVGGHEVRNRVSRKAADDKVQFNSLKTMLIVEAAYTYLSNFKELGQGIHPLPDERLLIINGHDATIYDGKKFTRHDHPMLNQQFLVWDNNLRWIDTEKLEQTVLAMNKERALKILSKLLDLIAQWRFSGRDDVYLMAGWILAQIVQSIWAWRPQLWLSGSSGSGKSWLTLLLEAIGGDLVLRFEGNALTEPGLRQRMKYHNYMVIIDEFEESKHREQIIERLRSAGHGGQGAIGSINQAAITYNLRHMFLVASIETSLIRAAEQYRFLQIHTVKDNSREPTIPNQSRCDELRLDLVAYAIWAVNQAKKLIRHLPTMAGYDNRWIASVAVPMSMVAVATEEGADDLDTLHELIKSYASEWSQRQASAGDQTDEATLVEDILMAKIRVSEDQSTEHDIKSVYVERTVSQLLLNQPMPHDYDQSLQAHGIRFIKENGSLCINPDVVSRELLRNTRWRTLNIRDILARVDGARRERFYIAGTQIRGIQIPISAWHTGDEE